MNTHSMSVQNNPTKITCKNVKMKGRREGGTERLKAGRGEGRKKMREGKHRKDKKDG